MFEVKRKVSKTLNVSDLRSFHKIGSDAEIPYFEYVLIQIEFAFEELAMFVTSSK